MTATPQAALNDSNSRAARSTESKILMIPMSLELGDEIYEVPVLSRKDARPWKVFLEKKLHEFMSGEIATATPEQLNTEGASEKIIKKALDQLLQVPDLLLEILFEYSQELANHVIVINDDATDLQIVVAMEQVVASALPYRRGLGTLFPNKQG